MRIVSIRNLTSNVYSLSVGMTINPYELKAISEELRITMVDLEKKYRDVVTLVDEGKIELVFSGSSPVLIDSYPQVREVSSQESNKYESGWELSSLNPVLTPLGKRFYYPTFEYLTTPINYLGTDYVFWCSAATASGGPNETFFSNDFVNWVGPIDCPGINGFLVGALYGYHASSCYVAGDVKPLKMWLWCNMPEDLFLAESADGVNWTTTPAPLVYPSGWSALSYGVTHVNYNPNATDTGKNPKNWKYWGTCSGETVGREMPFLFKSADGITWVADIVSCPLESIRGFSGNEDVKPSRIQFVSRMSVCEVEEDNSWFGFANGGASGSADDGLYLIKSGNGLFFERNTYQPHQQFGDVITGEGIYGDSGEDRLIGQPCLRRVGDRVFLMWVVQTTDSSSSRKGCVAWFDLIV